MGRAPSISKIFERGIAKDPSFEMEAGVEEVIVCSNSEVLMLSLFFVVVKRAQVSMGRVVLSGTTLLCSANTENSVCLFMEKFKE